MISQNEIVRALPWLHGKLHLDEEANLYYLIGNLRLGRHAQYYRLVSLRTRDGGFRTLHVPKDPLLLQVQREIKNRILAQFPKSSASHGFMGGSCHKAARAHRGFRSVLSFDLRHAFSSVSHDKVYRSLYLPSPIRPYLFHYAARFVADLCTVGEIQSESCSGVEWSSTGGMLPQGACTSPYLFEMCMQKLDENLCAWANRFSLTYTRYADNLYFSSAEEEFPPRPRAVVLSEVRKEYQVHKIHQVSGGRLCRMLGLSVTPDAVHNTRSFKLSFRKALHHVRWLLDNGREYESAWQVARGYRGFAVTDTISPKLLDQFEQLRQRIHVLEWGF